MPKKNMKIMVAVDFTSHSDKLVEYSISMAQALGAKVRFVHVAESFAGYDMLLVHPSFEQITTDLKHKADEIMANLIEDNKDKVSDVTGEVLIGDPADKLLEYAEGEDFDMLIVGTHGTKGLERILMGSVASKVSQNAPCPILIVNPSRYLEVRWKKGAGNRSSK